MSDKIIKTTVEDNGEIILKGESGQEYLLEYDDTGLGDNWESVSATKIRRT